MATYTRGETATCQFTLENLSGFPVTCYARIYLGYQIAGVTWYDSTSRVWVTCDLGIDEAATFVAHPVVKSDAPEGWMVGRLYIYVSQSETSACLTYQNLANAAEISLTKKLGITGQEWI